MITYFRIIYAGTMEISIKLISSIVKSTPTALGMTYNNQKIIAEQKLLNENKNRNN